MSNVVSTNPTLAKLVFDVLEDFAASNRLFSAYDVTREVRKLNAVRGQQVSWIGHQDVRDLVHSAYDTELPPFQNGSDYVRDDFTCQIGHNPVTFQVYRPIDKPLEDYQPMNFAASKPKLTHMPSLPTPIVPSQVTTGPVARKDKRGRVCVPNNIVKDANLLPGQYASVFGYPGGIAILHSGENPDNLAMEYLGDLKVDKDGNIRISKWMSEAVGLKNDNKVELDNKIITTK